MLLFGFQTVVATSDATSLPCHTRTDNSNRRSAPANVTTVLTVTSVSISDNGTDYFCAQGFNERSDTVYLTVLGKACMCVFMLGHLYCCIGKL